MGTSPYRHAGWPRPPECVVLHYTAGDFLKSAVSWMTRPNAGAAGASAHDVVDLDGRIVQVVPEADRAWHAGASAWNGRSGVNSMGFGIELVNFGYGVKTGDGALVRMHDQRNWTSKSVAAEGVVDVRSKWKGYAWAAYPMPQVQAAIGRIRDLLFRYHIDPTQVVGHEHVAPGRKQDPGPAFPWDVLTAELADVPCDEVWAVKAVQSHCARLDADPGVVDGDPGPKTKTAAAEVVKRYGELYRLPLVLGRWRPLAEALRKIPG